MDVEEVSESTIGSATQSISPTIVNNTSKTAKEETADETSDDEAQGAVIDNIINRVANKEFPLALPSQQKTLETSDAENIVTSVTQYEQTTVTNFIEEKWKEYRSSVTKDVKKNENLFYAEWIRDFYYVHLQVFIEDHNHSTQKQKAIISLLNLTDAGTEVVTKISDFATWIKEDQLAEFSNFVEATIQQEIGSLPDIMQKDTENMRKVFLLNEYTTVMKQFREHKEKCWKPDIDPEQAICPKLQEKARQLVLLAQKVDMLSLIHI